MQYLLSLFVLGGAVFLALAYLVDFKIEFGRPKLQERRRKRPLLKGCGPFEMTGSNEWGVLFLHGLSGSPAQMKPFAEQLNGAGMHCYGPVLPGHATHPDDLYYIDWTAWYRAARDEYLKVRSRHEKVMVVGFSLGAALGLRLGAEFPDIDRCVFISTPLKFFHKYLPTEHMLKVAWLFSNVSRSWPKKYPQGPDGPEYLIYPYLPLDALFAVTDLARQNREIIGDFRIPLLMVHSSRDPSSKIEGARYIFSNVASSYKKMIVYEKAPHGLMHDGTEEQKELLVRSVVEFAGAELS
ncbi:MAG: alpha/beta fold hydrolase [Planctomycetes bacterium]|nr:alpha/beta fold hydrolase [Planctomycetota bacterium]